MKAVFTLFVIFAGVAGAMAQRNEIAGVQWTLTQANGEPVAGSLAYIQFEENGRFTGNTGCNRMFGNAALRGQRVDISNIGTTKRMCKLPAGSVSETAFLRALERSARYDRNGNNLSLYDRRGRALLRFRRQVRMPPVEEPAPSAGIESKRWVLESIGDRRTLVPVKGVFINFDAAKGSAGGNSGCNVFGGEYRVNGSRISITEIVSTMRACAEDDRMTVEREFFDGLRTANRFEIRENRLFLYRGQNLLLTLRGEAKS